MYYSIEIEFGHFLPALKKEQLVRFSHLFSSRGILGNSNAFTLSSKTLTYIYNIVCNKLTYVCSFNTSVDFFDESKV